MSAMFQYFKSWFGSRSKATVEQRLPEEELTLRLKPYERHLYKIQDIITWKDVNLSIANIIVVNITFWFISCVEWRFVGVFFTALSMALIHDAWVNHIWPEIRIKGPETREGSSEVLQSSVQPEGVLSLLELSRYATEFQTKAINQYEKLKFLRSTYPPMFALLSSSLWISIAALGSMVSGMTLLYVLTLAVLTLPGVYIHVIAPHCDERMAKFFNLTRFVLMPPESSKSVDEYLPDANQENLDILAKAGDNSNDLSTPSSDSSMVDLIPGHDESSVDSFTLPTVEKADASETDSECDALSFKNSHFNGNSSGEDEGSLVGDLSFPEVPPIKDSPASSKGLTSTIAGVFYKTFPNITGRLQFRATGEGIVSPPIEDSDSEFEIIDEDS